MDDTYRNIFEAMYTHRPPLYPAGLSDYQSFWAYPLGPDELGVQKAIDGADEGLYRSKQRRLRADAKYFLFVNFMQMVFAPVRLHGLPITPEMFSSLVADIELVVDEAARQQHTRDRASSPGLVPEQSDLSSHAVLEAVANNWGKLKLSSFQIWGEV